MAISDHLLFDIVIPRIYLSNNCICTPISCPSIPCFCDGIHYQRIWYCAPSWFSFISHSDAFTAYWIFSCYVGCSSQWSSCKFQTWSWGEDGHPACCLWWNSFLVHIASIGSFIRLGLGAFTSPLVATQFTQLRHWSFHYIVSLGIAICNTLVLFLIFGIKTLDGGLIYLFPLTRASLLFCSRVSTSYRARHSREGGRRT